MKPFITLLLFSWIIIYKASAQDTINVMQAADYINKTVTFCPQVSDFDSKQDNIYLYFGERFPKQKLAVIIKRTNGKKRIKLKRDIMLGREMVYFTGIITVYNGEPDTSANYDTDAIKSDIETDKPMFIGNQHGMGHMNYTARTVPVDLKGKLVMIITDQKQIGRKVYYPQMSLY
jgi:hypothetical protein